MVKNKILDSSYNNGANHHKPLCIIVRYGELFLKGQNRHYFIQQLIDNINLAFHHHNFQEFQLKKFSDQLLITTSNEKDLVNMLPVLGNIFGISVYYLTYQLESSVEELYKFVENLANYYDLKVTDFRFNISRNNKKFPQNSLTLQNELGDMVRKKYNLKVKLTNPQKTFYVLIYHDFILFFTEKISGLGGLPVGSSGKVLLLLSGGIDSPVAAYQLMKRGLAIVYLHFYQQQDGQEKITELCQKLEIYNNYSNEIYLVDSQPFLTEIRHLSQEKYRLIILKRMFIRVADLLAQKLAIKAVATGDSLAQVASQTLESLITIQVVNSLILLWPLIAWDKKEIITEAKKIGTYELSLKKYVDCCALFEPRHPATKPQKKVAEKLENEIL